jgi:hypothetical protein
LSFVKRIIFGEPRRVAVNEARSVK